MDSKSGKEFILYRTLRRVIIKDLTYKHRDVLGLDLGTTAVKFAQLKSAGRLTKLVGYGSLNIPENIIIEGVIAEPEKLANVLNKVFADPPWGKITAERVIASLPEARVFTRIIDLPLLADKDIKEAINYEVEQSIPIPANDLYIDWQPIEETEEKKTIFLSAAPKAIVDSYVQLFKLLEMEPLAVEVSMAAIARAMISNKETSEPVIIFDLGGQSTNLAVFDSNLKVTESIPIGGLAIKEAVSEKCNVSILEATNLIRQGMTENNKISEIIENQLNKIINELEKMVGYFQDKNEKVKISKVLLCGGLGYLPGLPELIKEKIKIEAKIGNPWVNISIYPIKPVPKDDAPGYAAAIGLCLRGLYD